MSSVMSDAALANATGKNLEEWSAIIAEANLAEASHQDIVAFLHDSQEQEYWWAQEITVQYEKRIGRRVTGQTLDGKFQLGVSKTYTSEAQELWNQILSAAGISLLLDAETEKLELGSEGRTSSGTQFKVTTFEEGSHFRLRYQLPDWEEHSILQIRVTPKGEGKSTLTFHHEALPSSDEREAFRSHWRDVAAGISRLLKSEN